MAVTYPPLPDKDTKRFLNDAAISDFKQFGRVLDNRLKKMMQGPLKERVAKANDLMLLLERLIDPEDIEGSVYGYGFMKDVYNILPHTIRDLAEEAAVPYIKKIVYDGDIRSMRGLCGLLDDARGYSLDGTIDYFDFFICSMDELLYETENIKSGSPSYAEWIYDSVITMSDSDFRYGLMYISESTKALFAEKDETKIGILESWIDYESKYLPEIYGLMNRAYMKAECLFLPYVNSGIIYPLQYHGFKARIGQRKEFAEKSLRQMKSVGIVSNSQGQELDADYGIF